MLKPLFFLLVCGLILYPARRAVMRWLPAGRLKRLLLFRLTDD
jgi:hypothetical protein